MVATTEKITLLSVEQKSFTGKDGKLVEYKAATLLDNNGNKFIATVDKECEALADTPLREDGVAKVELFINSFDGQKPLLKMRVLGWEAK